MNWSEHDFVREDVKLHYWQKGAGAPILLLHGITDNGACWGRTADALAAHYTVYAPDQRGHGKSDAPLAAYTYADYVADALELLRVSGHANALVMGHSFGGVVALNLAAEFPQAVSKLIVVDPPLFDIDAAMPPFVLERERYNFFEWLRKLKPLSRAEMIQVCQTQSPTWSDDECETWADSKMDASLHLWEQGGIPMQSDWRAWLHAITCPTLLVYGDAQLGSLIDEEKAAQVVRTLRQGTSARIPNAGHSVHRDQFATFMRAINLFLDEDSNTR